MALSKIDTGALAADAVDNTILDLTANFDFTGTITGAGGWTAVASQIGTPDAAAETQTGIPSGTRELLMVWDKVAQSVASPDPFVVRLGTSSGLKTSGYDTQSRWSYDPSEVHSVNHFATGILDIGNWGSGSKWSGFIYCWNSTGNKWISDVTIQDTTGTYNVLMKYLGVVDLGGTLDRIGVSVGSGTLNGGNISVFYK